ncbi:MAG: hypothetical protein APR63_02615 [Desulfuromonas sp. SDB]|nr:MAG: hypothetical protein APR63_02615 [Desulfuromonas sp. SDB]
MKLQKKDRYYEFILEGEFNAENVNRQITQIAEICKKDRVNKIMAILTELSGDISIVDRYSIGKHGASYYLGVKVAVVLREDQMKEDLLGETAARNRGLNVKDFTSWEKAEKWLID